MGKVNDIHMHRYGVSLAPLCFLALAYVVLHDNGCVCSVKAKLLPREVRSPQRLSFLTAHPHLLRWSELLSEALQQYCARRQTLSTLSISFGLQRALQGPYKCEPRSSLWFPKDLVARLVVAVLGGGRLLASGSSCLSLQRKFLLTLLSPGKHDNDAQAK